MNKKKVYIFGHKNPDTDSICSAIACAYLKNEMAKQYKENEVLYMGKVDRDSVYEARRAGVINPETEYVLKRFDISTPKYVSDVRRQVRDINIRQVQGIQRSYSLKQAWKIMREVNISTLPILNDCEELEGIITMSDIARAYMAVFDKGILSAAKTPYKNIIDALEGKMLVGSVEDSIESGEIFIAAANIEKMKEHIHSNDIVILGNRYETQLFAIENKVGCIIVCEGAPVSRTISKLAEENGCKIISSPHDTYTVARLITQSVPVSYFMREDVVAFKRNEFIDDIKGTMTKLLHRDFPVITKDGKFSGMISRRSLLNMPDKHLILVDHNEVDQAIKGIEETEIVEIIDHHKLGTVETIKPLLMRNEPVGCTATIIYHMFMENRIEIPKNIAGILCSAILSDTLLFRSPTCTPVDEDAAKELAQIAEVAPQELAESMFKEAGNLDQKTDEEIFYQDYKKFVSNGVTFGVGQILVMSNDELRKIRKRIFDYVKKARVDKGVDMIFLLLTNIIEESSDVLFDGERAQDVLEESFEEQIVDGSMILPGVVSRKKQFIPPIMGALQQ